LSFHGAGWPRRDVPWPWRRKDRFKVLPDVAGGDLLPLRLMGVVLESLFAFDSKFFRELQE
jgi:hypothetical protein